MKRKSQAERSRGDCAFAYALLRRLAELKQDHDDLAGAIDVVEQLEPTTYAAVSLAELYAQPAAGTR